MMGHKHGCILPNICTCIRKSVSTKTNVRDIVVIILPLTVRWNKTSSQSSERLHGVFSKHILIMRRNRNQWNSWGRKGMNEQRVKNVHNPISLNTSTRNALSSINNVCIPAMVAVQNPTVHKDSNIVHSLEVLSQSF